VLHFESGTAEVVGSTGSSGTAEVVGSTGRSEVAHAELVHAVTQPGRSEVVVHAVTQPSWDLYGTLRY